jgi:acetoin utilization deacetylase AcuC-like enzyme
MKLFFDDRQMGHQPSQYMVHGRIVDPFENPNRASNLITALKPAGLTPALVSDAGPGAIADIHQTDYLDFLRTAYADFQALPKAGPEVLPNVYSYRGASDGLTRGRCKPTGILGRAGWYMGDLSCAMMAGTWDAAYWSAQGAIAAADSLLATGNASFALCRPPGHHAYTDRASGFCYLNNAAIAAQRLRSQYASVAVIDFDTHHGDGTQAIFYARPDVFYGSVHTDPSAYYPHFAGYADELGVGAGVGFNLNFPLPQGSDDEAFIGANTSLAGEVQRLGCQALVLSAGWDAHKDDPLSKLNVTTGAFGKIGDIWGSMNLPTVIVQEGGYSLSASAEAAPVFMRAFLTAAMLQNRSSSH